MSADPVESKTLLIGFFNRLRTLRAEIADLNADCNDVRKEVRSAGFDSTKLMEVIRWFEKVDKHGLNEMQEAEAIYHLYRDVVDSGPAKFDELMASDRDRDLLRKFAPDDQVEAKLNKRMQGVKNALAMAQAAKAARSAT